MKPGTEIHISKDAETLNKDAAEWIVKYINEVVAKNDRFTFALSGRPA